MEFPASGANQIWRNFTVDTVAASGVHGPAKGEIRSWASEIEDYITKNESVVFLTPTVAGTSLAPNVLSYTVGTPTDARAKVISVKPATDLGGDVYYRLDPDNQEKLAYFANEIPGGHDLILFQGTFGSEIYTTVSFGEIALVLFKGTGTASQVSNLSTTVKTGNIKDSAVVSNKLANNAVTGNKIPSNTITTAHLVNNAVQSENITDGAIITSKIGNSQITGPLISPGSVSASKMAQNAIATTNIQDAAVTAAKLASTITSVLPTMGTFTPTFTNSAGTNLIDTGGTLSGLWYQIGNIMTYHYYLDVPTIYEASNIYRFGIPGVTADRGATNYTYHKMTTLTKFNANQFANNAQEGIFAAPSGVSYMNMYPDFTPIDGYTGSYTEQMGSGIGPRMRPWVLLTGTLIYEVQ